MSTNFKSNAIQTRVQSPVDDPSAVSLLYLMHLMTQLPVMRSREGFSLPHQPNLAAMRERREQRKTSLSELKRIHTVEWSEFPKLESAEAYEIPKLVPRGKKNLAAASSKDIWHIGPTGAGAEKIEHKKLPANRKLSIDDFVKKHSRDFEIWINPIAENYIDMKGMIIVIAEHHYDPAVQANVKEVMLGFRRARGDRFFQEGGELALGPEREKKFAMDPGDCILVEKYSPIYARGFARLQKLLKLCLACVEYIQKHVPESRNELSADNIYAYTQFIGRRSKELPLAAISDFNKLMSELNREAEIDQAKTKAEYPLREAYIADFVRKQRSTSALNFLAMGSDHLQAMRESLKDLPCIFMVPRLMVKKNPSLSLESKTKQEL